MTRRTFTSDLVLALDESVVTDALEHVGTEYIKLPVKGTPPEPIRAVLLYFDAWGRTYVFERVGRYGPRLPLDCRRTDFPDWLLTGEGPEVIARLLAFERSVVDDGPVQVDGEFDPAQIRSITPETVDDGVRFWGTLELDLTATAIRRRPPSRPAAHTLLRVPGTVTEAFTLVDVNVPGIALEIAIAADRSVTFRVGDLFWGRRAASDCRLRGRIETLLDTERFRRNFQDAVRARYDGDLHLELSGTLPLDVVKHVDLHR